MNRIEKKFNDSKASGKKCLISYITAGDPEKKITADLMHTLVSSGTDIIELGIPFSDPMADGPVIQKACERALINKTSCKDIFNIVKEFRKKNETTPVVLMGYLNPIERIGYENFSSESKKSGVDGVLVVDLPHEEAQDIVNIFKKDGLDSIFLIAPNSTQERILNTLKYASGFLYYVSLKGVTGAKNIDIDDTISNLKKIKEDSNIPLAVGFGINNAESARLISKHSDAVVVGSSIIKVIENNLNKRENIINGVSKIVNEIRTALDWGHINELVWKATAKKNQSKHW